MEREQEEGRWIDKERQMKKGREAEAVESIA